MSAPTIQTEFPHGSSDTHDEIRDVPATALKRQDVVHHEGDWLTITAVLTLKVREEVAIYLTERRVIVPQKVTFTVYRPKVATDAEA